MSWTERIVEWMPEPNSNKDLRSFGLIVGGIFGAIAAWPLVWRGLPVRLWAVALAGPLVVAAAVYPGILRYPYRGWMFIGHCLGWVNTRVLMALIFHLIFTPVATVMRLMKRDAMTRRFDRSMRSYRVVRTARAATHLKHPF